jgi:RarD protein
VVFIWAVNSGHVLESSLGYYIIPLDNMAVGTLMFRERINRIGMVAIGLAVVGVVLQTVALGALPLASLAIELLMVAVTGRIGIGLMSAQQNLVQRLQESQAEVQEAHRALKGS